METNEGQAPTPTSETKQYRKELDAVLQKLKLSSIATGVSGQQNPTIQDGSVFRSVVSYVNPDRSIIRHHRQI